MKKFIPLIVIVAILGFVYFLITKLPKVIDSNKCIDCVRKAWAIAYECDMYSSNYPECEGWFDVQKDYCTTELGCDFCAVESELELSDSLYPGDYRTARAGERDSRMCN
tara:strand:+ start:5107 stop:5433 length:327 start_codon:yes stop_codon:yes gene_type:complete